MTDGVRSSLICDGCGLRVPTSEVRPFTCSNAHPEDDTDHVLRRRLEVPDGERERLGAAFLEGEANPFLRYRALLHGYRAAVERGVDDATFVELVRWLDDTVLEVVGTGFRETPLSESSELAAELGCGEVWIKDETENVGGTHKGRHLAGVLLWLLLMERLGELDRHARARLAISSCGNAAWAATLLARSVGWEIDVYVPGDVSEAVAERLSMGRTLLNRCVRRPGEAGDPCYLRFSEAVASGSLPFSCQGPNNGLAIEGGQTLIWEILSVLLRERRSLDRLFIQTGGGALASSYVLGWREARKVLDIGRLPQLHAVQTTGAAPLVRAYDALASRLSERQLGRDRHVQNIEERALLAEQIHSGIEPSVIREELRYAASHRSQFMWPWEEEPQSVADAILDDETYDWLPLLSGMFESGGYPVVVTEEELLAANDLGRRRTSINVGDTGSAGLAGALELSRAGLLGGDDRVGLLFSGVRWRRRPRAGADA